VKTFGDDLGIGNIVRCLYRFRSVKYDSDHVMKKNNIISRHSSPLALAEGYILAKTPDDFTH
jgi:hypothetical protein